MSQMLAEEGSLPVPRPGLRTTLAHLDTHTGRIRLELAKCKYTEDATKLVVSRTSLRQRVREVRDRRRAPCAALHAVSVKLSKC